MASLPNQGAGHSDAEQLVDYKGRVFPAFAFPPMLCNKLLDLIPNMGQDYV